MSTQGSFRMASASRWLEARGRRRRRQQRQRRGRRRAGSEVRVLHVVCSFLVSDGCRSAAVERRALIGIPPSRRCRRSRGTGSRRACPGCTPSPALMHSATSADRRWAQAAVVMQWPVESLKHWPQRTSFSHAALALALPIVRRRRCGGVDRRSVAAAAVVAWPAASLCGGRRPVAVGVAARSPPSSSPQPAISAAGKASTTAQRTSAPLRPSRCRVDLVHSVSPLVVSVRSASVVSIRARTTARRGEWIARARRAIHGGRGGRTSDGGADVATVMANIRADPCVACVVLALPVDAARRRAVRARATTPWCLERLPHRARDDPAARRVRELRAALAARPDDLELAIRVAWLYIEAGRASSDPRYYGYAQGALAPWWRDGRRRRCRCWCCAPRSRQHDHDFAGALDDLARALRADPTNAQAWLTQAVVQQVRGDYAAARHSCLAVLRLARPAGRRRPASAASTASAAPPRQLRARCRGRSRAPRRRRRRARCGR